MLLHIFELVCDVEAFILAFEHNVGPSFHTKGKKIGYTKNNLAFALLLPILTK